ncbi:MAG: phosphatidylcholine/phosphatidylserine synthase [Roseiflexaceae bacterium]
MLRTAPWQRASAMAVHLYTASGAVLALLIVQAAVQGNAVQALWFGLIAMIIDGTDGTLARRFRVRETLPWFDGARLDDIVDYLTYVFAPVMLLLSGGYLPEGPGGMVLAALPLLASSYQFCRVDAKTDDHFFLGFPSYWNVVAFYAITQQWTPTLTTAVLVVCSVLVFVPIRYLYPSRTVAFRKLTLVISALWLISYALILAQMPQPSSLLLNASILFVIYYVGMSVYLTLKKK